MNVLNKFVRNESGAVTVDWVALTAGLLLLGAALAATILGGAGDLADNITTILSSYTPGGSS